VVGAVGDITGNKRHSFWFLLLMMAVPILIFGSIDVKKGKQDARDFAVHEHLRREEDKSFKS
jgi:MFS-type transporter involved in bile tolerance (Atg22 family)